MKAAGKSRRHAGRGDDEARDPNYVPRFKKRYNEVIKPELMKEFGYKNAHAGSEDQQDRAEHRRGRGASDAKKIQQALNDLTAIAGQKAVVTQGQEVDRDLQDPRRPCRSA